ncbi:MAG: arsenate reductase ArsC [Rhodothermales bacterium]
MPNVLFVCTHNSARSQMAEGLLRHLYGDHYTVYSAGTERTFVKPPATEAMRRAGIDISAHTSKTVEDVADIEMDYVVTVCDSAREACPYVPSKRQTLHHSFWDPSNAEGDEEAKVQAFAQVRDEIRDWIITTFHPNTGTLYRS